MISNLLKLNRLRWSAFGGGMRTISGPLRTTLSLASESGCHDLVQIPRAGSAQECFLATGPTEGLRA
jgi:hypothetical protein